MGPLVSCLFNGWIKWRIGSVGLGLCTSGFPGFYQTFFGNVAETAAKTAFKKSREGDNPLYYEESWWDGWPQDTKHEDVLS
jgi:hypothetical protein